MKRAKKLSILVIFCLLISLIFLMAVNKIYAKGDNNVTLNFEGGIIGYGYVEYSEIGKLQLFKGDELVTNISNDMKIDLNESSYEFVIEEISSENKAPIRLNINNWYYPMTTLNYKSTFKLESSEFNGTLNVKLERKRTVVNTKVENNFTYFNIAETIDLSKKYIIDFSKNDDLTQSLKLFADVDKTLYYKIEDGKLSETESENDAIIKIVGNKNENNAIIIAVNIGDKKEEKVKGIKVKFIGSKLKYDNAEDGIINEIRYDYYTTSEYDFTFKYVKEEAESKEYKIIEGANQTYTKNESENATFKVDAEYSLFENGGKVYIDNILVDSKYYTSKSGSTVITLTDTYLKTLSRGEHTLKVVFTDGGEAITTFTIKEQNIEEDNKNTANEEKQENISNDSNPKTGDNIIGYTVLFVSSIAGIVILSVINRKKQQNK